MERRAKSKREQRPAPDPHPKQATHTAALETSGVSNWLDAGRQPTESAVLRLQSLIGNQNTRSLLANRASAPDVQRDDSADARKKPVTTPPFSWTGPMPGAIPPDNERENVDAEGNTIRHSASGKWYLLEPPKNLEFPIAAGAKTELLPMNPNASYRALKARCEAIRDEQLALAEGLRGDMKYWFAKVYHYVTKFELEAIEAGAYQYPHMKMQEVILFYTTYKENLDNWANGAKDKVEANWKEAFSAAESENGGTWYKPKSLELKKALLPSMEAHIRFDLPRAMAAAYNTHYEGIPGASISDFKDDFFKMAPVFDKAQAELAPEMDEETWEVDPGDWDWLQEGAFPFFFHVGMEREHAWERAQYIAKNRGKSPKAMQQGLRNSQNARHPMQTDLFDVDGTDVGDEYDWTNQPGNKPDPEPPGPRHLPAPNPPITQKRLFFKYDRPRDGENLEKAVRSDQDLHFLLDLANWTREVRDAEIYLEGHASSEGPDYHNNNLASTRANLVEFFLFRADADLRNNKATQAAMGETGAEPKAEWRYVDIVIRGQPVSKQQAKVPNPNLPGEVSP